MVFYPMVYRSEFWWETNGAPRDHFRYHWFPGFRHPPGETPTGTMVFSGENPLKLGTSMVICWGKKYKYTSLSGTKRKLLAQENQKKAIHGLTAISEPQNCAITMWWGDHLHQGRAKQGAVPRLFGPAKFFLIFKDPIFTRVYWITYIVKTVFFQDPNSIYNVHSGLYRRISKKGLWVYKPTSPFHSGHDQNVGPKTWPKPDKCQSRHVNLKKGINATNFTSLIFPILSPFHWHSPKKQI